MKKAVAALSAIFAVLGVQPVQADEMPIKGTCVKDGENVSFTGVRRPPQTQEVPILEPSVDGGPSLVTGHTTIQEAGLTQIWMSLQDYELLLGPHIQVSRSAPGEDGMIPATIGEHSFRISTDVELGKASLKGTTDNFLIYFQDSGDEFASTFFDWKCTIRPDLP